MYKKLALMTLILVAYVGNLHCGVGGGEDLEKKRSSSSCLEVSSDCWKVCIESGDTLAFYDLRNGGTKIHVEQPVFNPPWSSGFFLNPKFNSRGYLTLSHQGCNLPGMHDHCYKISLLSKKKFLVGLCLALAKHHDCLCSCPLELVVTLTEEQAQ